MKFFKTVLVASVSLYMSLGSAFAATVPFFVDFDTVPPTGFSMTAYNPSSYAIPNNCGGNCLLLANNQSVEFSLIGLGTFSISSFLFNGTGSDDGAFTVSTALNGVGDLFTESNNGNTMTTALVNYTGLTSIFFKNTGTGSSRLDGITGVITTPAAVPLPAAGMLLLAGLSGLAALRRRKPRAV